MKEHYYIFTNLLSEEETKIITSIIHHIERGEKRSGIQQIAAENFVSPTFIMKMCKRLGFDGYSELYYYLTQRAGAEAESASADALRDLVDNYSDEQVNEFCNILWQMREQKMFVVGNGFSALVANYIVQRLAVCGFMVFNSVHFYDFMIFHEQSEQLDTNIDPSAIIAISQSGESDSVINDVKNARQNGFKVISFTKREESTLAQLSDITFIIDGTKQMLVSAIPNPFFGRSILAFEELMARYFACLPKREYPGRKKNLH